ncbi:MAG TPA: hypothetical protein VKA67_09450, partial [Verrucomicrobiae bacterium]|nr:hypothetical protein [Verrucomicrobiae bacterium]
MNGFQLHFAVLFLPEATSGFFALGIGTATVFFALLLLPGVWWIAQRTNRRALRLAEDLAGQIAKLNVELHDAHLPVAEYPHGLRSIAGQVNKLVASFDATLAKERRLSANLAHELATPVAELRALAEVALQ